MPGVTTYITKPKRTLEDLEGERTKRRKHQLAHCEDLMCDICGARLGMVYDNDLNGSAFFCHTCWGKG